MRLLVYARAFTGVICTAGTDRSYYSRSRIALLMPWAVPCDVVSQIICQRQLRLIPKSPPRSAIHSVHRPVRMPQGNSYRQVVADGPWPLREGA